MTTPDPSAAPVYPREHFFRSLWPDGAPIEAWAEKCIDPAVKRLSQYVLHLEAQLADADQDANDLMAVAYRQGQEASGTITTEEARERFPGWGEDVA